MKNKIGFYTDNPPKLHIWRRERRYSRSNMSRYDNGSHCILLW